MGASFLNFWMHPSIQLFCGASCSRVPYVGLHIHVINITPTSNSSQRPRPHSISNSDNFPHSTRLSTPDRFSDYAVNHSKVPPLHVTDQSSGYRSHQNASNYEYSRRAFGATLDSTSQSRSHRHSISSRITDPSYQYFHDIKCW